MPLHLKYRPETLDTIIGHSEAVTRMKGIVRSGNVPSALLITGPTSVGKTTLARAFAADLSGMGKNFLRTPDYLELNFSEQRSIDDIRELQKICRFKPQMSKYRVIVADEAQGIISAPAAGNAALKLIEESQGTCWILCSMNPEKFTTTVLGKAIANRCVQFNLTPPTTKDMIRQAMRICKGEGMKYMLDPEHALLKTIIRASNCEMRTLAQLLEACQQYYNGLDEKPEVLPVESLSSVLSSVTSDEDKFAADLLLGLYGENLTTCQLQILNSNDAVGLANKISFINGYVLNSTILQGKKHPKVWFSAQNKRVVQALQKNGVTLGEIAEVQTRITECRAEMMQFGVGADSLLSAFCYRTIRKLQSMRNGNLSD